MKYFFGVLFFLLFVGSVFASSWGLFYSNDDYFFEVNNNGLWIQSNYPYSFYYGNYYFFDSPFRYYHNGAFSYYPSGWYDFGGWSFDYYSEPGAWSFNPWDGSYVSYYSPQYYYWEYDWYYYPNWIPTYGYTYYGYDFDGVFNSGDTTGDMFQYTQTVDCSELSILSNSVSINAGESKEVEIELKNNSGFDFHLSNASVFVDSWDVDARIIDFDEEISAGETGKIVVELNAEDSTLNESSFFTIKLNGLFADTTNCSSNKLRKKISLTINGNNQNYSNNYYSNQNNYYQNSNYSNQKYSNSSNYNYSNHNFEEPGEWVDVEFSEQEYENTAEPVSNNAPSPNLVSVFTHSFSMSKNSVESSVFFILNNSNWSLIIDSVEVDSSDFSSVGELVDGSIVPSKSSASVKVTVSSENDTGLKQGLLKISGHFSDGTPFYFEKEFNVLVKKDLEKIELKEKITSFELVVPKKISSNEFSIFLNNPFNEQARVYLKCSDCSLNKNKIIVEGKSKKTEIIKVLNNSNNAVITYSIRMSGRNFQNKKTLIEIVEETKNNTRKEKPNFVLIKRFPSIVKTSKGSLKIVLKNYSSEKKLVELNFKDINGETKINSTSLTIEPMQEKKLLLPFTVTKFYNGRAKIVLLMNYGTGFESKEIEFVEKKPVENKKQEPTIIASALATLGNNASLGLIILLFILITIILFKQYEKTKEEKILTS